MPLPGHAIPRGARIAVLIDGGLHRVVDEERVAEFDVVEALDDRLGRKRAGAPGAEVPLEETDPEAEVGDGGGAGIELDALELVGSTVWPVSRRDCWEYPKPRRASLTS